MTLHELMVAIDSMPEDALDDDARAVALIGFDTGAGLDEQQPQERAITDIVIDHNPISLTTDAADDATALTLGEVRAKLTPVVAIRPERLVVVQQDEEFNAIVTVAANRGHGAFAVIPAFEGYELLFDAPPSAHG